MRRKKHFNGVLWMLSTVIILCYSVFLKTKKVSKEWQPAWKLKLVYSSRNARKQPISPTYEQLKFFTLQAQLDIWKKHLFPWNKFKSHTCAQRFSFFYFPSKKRTKFLAFFTDLNCKRERTLGLSMGHSNLKSESFALSCFLSLFDVRNYVWSTVSNILIVCVLRKFYFAQDFIIFWITWNLISFEVCFPTKTSANFFFHKYHEDAKNKCYIYSIIYSVRSIHHYLKKELCSDTNEIQQMQPTNSTNPSLLSNIFINNAST